MSKKKIIGDNDYYYVQEFPEIDSSKIYVECFDNGIICQLFIGDGEYFVSQIGLTESSGSAYEDKDEIFNDPRGKWYELNNIDEYIKLIQGERNFKRVLPIDEKFHRFYLDKEN